MEKNINIFVACHKPTYVLKNPCIVPIQVGTALTDWRGSGMKYDNTGDNISAKNPDYCELTAQYWVWKQEKCDYYGFFHYRRYLAFDKIYPVASDGALKEKKAICPYIELDDIKENLSAYRLDEARIQQVIADYDLITVLRERINTTVYRQFCQYHQKESLDSVLRIAVRKYPQYEAAAKQYMESKEIYYMNMYIMKKTLFQEYMTWIFDILGEYELENEQGGNLTKEPRMMGYLAERLFGIFYTYQREHGIPCAEVPYLKFYYTGEGEGAGKQTEVRTFRLKPTNYEIKIDMRKLNRMFPAGTRRRIWLRSLFLR